MKYFMVAKKIQKLILNLKFANPARELSLQS